MSNQEIIDSAFVELEHEVALSGGGQLAALGAVIAIVVIIAQ